MNTSNDKDRPAAPAPNGPADEDLPSPTTSPEAPKPPSAPSDDTPSGGTPSGHSPSPPAGPSPKPVTPKQPAPASPDRPRSPWPSLPAAPHNQPTAPTQDPPTTSLRTGAPSPHTPNGPAPARARADSGAHPAARYHQHRQYQGGEPPAPTQADLDDASLQAARRRRATGFTTGVLHALGFTLLAVYEYFRAVVSNLSPAQLTAGGSTELREIARTQADLMKQNWYEAISELARILTFDQPRAFLWAAVLIAIVVRFNRSGPALLQIGLSVLAAGYCLLLSLVWFPFLYGLGAATFAAMAVSGALLWATTRR